MTRKKLIAANWKMYKTPEQTTAFFAEFLPMVADHSRDEIVVCPPFVDLHAAVEAARGSNVAVGAQNMHWEKEGAFTGEVSPTMLTAIKVTHVIIGHSERRAVFQRNRRHGQPQTRSCAGEWTDAHRLRRRGTGGA